MLKTILSFQPDSMGKWAPNYEGPFVVKKVFSGGSMILTNMDCEDLSHSLNTDAVKKYFA